MEWGIKFRPIRLPSPHLNSRVERAQRNVLDESYPTVNLEDGDLQAGLDQREFYYNCLRIHDTWGNTPMDRCSEPLEKTPVTDEVYSFFDEDRERALQRNRPLARRVKK